MGKKICITGVSGLLGQNLVKVFSQNGYYTIGMDLNHPGEACVGLSEFREIDITNKEALVELFAGTMPDFVINTAAITNVDLCEKEQGLAERVNFRAVELLASVVPRCCKIIQLSTDYVFDGKNGPYGDNDKENPISWYGKTKRMAEVALLTANKNHLVVRTMVLVGKAKGLKPDFIHFVCESLSAGKRIRVVTDQVGNITLASNLAQNIKVAIEEGCSGVISLAGGERISRFDFAQRLAARYGLDNCLIDPITTAELKQPAMRPLSSGFTHEKAMNIKGIKLLSIEEMLEKYDNE